MADNNTNNNRLTLGEPEFFSTSQIQQYIGNARGLLRPLYHELHVSAEELEAALRYVRSANPAAFGLDSRVRARLVASHLRRAADSVEVTCAALVRTYLAFRKHYVAELHAAGHRGQQRREFKFGE